MSSPNFSKQFLCCSRKQLASSCAVKSSIDQGNRRKVFCVALFRMSCLTTILEIPHIRLRAKFGIRAETTNIFPSISLASTSASFSEPANRPFTFVLGRISHACFENFSCYLHTNVLRPSTTAMAFDVHHSKCGRPLTLLHDTAVSLRQPVMSEAPLVALPIN